MLIIFLPFPLPLPCGLSLLGESMFADEDLRFVVPLLIDLLASERWVRPDNVARNRTTLQATIIVIVHDGK